MPSYYGQNKAFLYRKYCGPMQIHKDQNYKPSSVELISLLFRILTLQVISKRHCLSTEHGSLQRHYRTVHFTELSALHLHSLILPTDWRGFIP